MWGQRFQVGEGALYWRENGKEPGANRPVGSYGKSDLALPERLIASHSAFQDSWPAPCSLVVNTTPLF